jgi:3-methyladenine DNA glycosylase AlkD
MRRSKPVEKILKRLQSLADPVNVAGMARFGIRPKKVYGIATPELKRMARQIGKEHSLALELWKTEIHEARVLASLVAEPTRFSARQMERWVKDFDSWAICDACCFNLFDKTKLAYAKALEWSARSEEFEKRAGFALMASLALHDKKAPDSRMLEFLPCIERESWDERNFVRKAVNWALRQIGKRNLRLNRAGIRSAKAIQKQASKAARWIAADALKELTSQAVQEQLLRTSFRK